MTGESSRGIDLPPALQKELDDLAAHEGRITHYRLLGVQVDADVATIRRAYLEKSRRFHPDSWYGKNLGHYAAILNRAFQRLSGSYQVITDETARSTYDRTHRELFTATEHMAVNRRLTTEEEDSRRARESRERLLRMKGFARLGAARQLYEHALQLAADGKRLEAIASLTCARELDPARKEISQRLAEMEKEQSKARAGSALALAKDQEESGKTEKALAMYQAALNLDPRAADAAMGGARCAAKMEDFSAQLTFSLRAVELLPGSQDAHMLAARAFASLKQKQRAKAELQLVLTRDPKHAEAKTLLKAL